MRSLFRLLAASLLSALLPHCCTAATCYAPEQAAALAGKDICLQAHVYAINEQPDGTRYLDVCAPGSAAGSCRFTVVSMAEDRAAVGSLDGLAEKDIRLRGTVHVIGEQAFVVLSAKRQLGGGAEKFRPNPALLSGFSGGSGAAAFRDPALSMHRRRGSSAFAGSASASR